MNPTKRCPSCGRDLPHSAFHTRRGGQLQSWCSTCSAGRPRSRMTVAIPTELHGALALAAEEKNLPVSAIATASLLAGLRSLCRAPGCLEQRHAKDPYCARCAALVAEAAG